MLSLKSGTFAKASTKAGRIDRDLYLDDATFKDELVMRGTTVRGSIIFNKGYFHQKVDLSLATVGTIEYKGTGLLECLDLTGTNANNVVGEVEKEEDLPRHLILHGFTYKSFTGKYTGEKAQVKQEKWFQSWLEKLQEYTPQPYEQCARVLRDAGQPEKANAVLYAGKEMERNEAWKNDNFKRWFWLSLMRATIGYGLGLRYFWSLWWVAGFVLAGSAVCYTATKSEALAKLRGKTVLATWVNCVFFSFDLLLPIVRLRDEHYKIDLPEWQRYYFYCHQLAGWLLAFFISAGLAGITQK
jgi:hypothetical protein